MRAVIPFLAAIAALSAPAWASLPVGAKAPDFTTRSALGGKVSTLKLSDALKKGPVALYFFPAAFTPGCTLEAADFAQATDDFGKAGATVIGMSADPIDKLQNSRSKHAAANSRSPPPRPPSFRAMTSSSPPARACPIAPPTSSRPMAASSTSTAT